MEPFEIKEALESFQILVDTREQPTERSKQRLAAMGFPYQRATLSYGDYSYTAMVNGKPLHDLTSTIEPFCIVERKMSIDELANNFCEKQKASPKVLEWNKAHPGERPLRNRFEYEFRRAADHGARMFLIVENATWENVINGKYRSRMDPHALFGSILAFCVRYHIMLIMCKEETSGKLIGELLYRDFKERLERGDYDGRGDPGTS